ncbi:MAG: fibronectin type III domain-containing protein [Candidatus Saccharimonadaceae bacterium]
MAFSAFLKRQLSDQSRLLFVVVGALSAIVFFGASSVVAEATTDPSDTTFTFAQVPDTQKEVHSDDNPLLPNRYQWLSDNKVALNLKFISQTGDLVDWGVVEPIQFTRASAATTILDDSGIPYSYALGNHDGAAVKEGGSAAPGTTKTLLRDTTLYNKTFPLSRFKNVGGTFEANKVDNMYQTFSAGGLDWLVLSHEMWPRDTVIQWMKQVVASHPTYNVVVTTHAFIDNAGGLPTTGNYGDKNAQYEWDNFISQYANIKMVLSGHYGPVNGVGGYYYKESTGVHGNKVAQIMTAYHSLYQNHVRLLQIDTANNSISSSVYVNLSLDLANYPMGYIHDTASDFVTTGMNWIRPAVVSVPTEPVTPTEPSAPQSVAATAGVASASVSFTPPSTSGGSAITSYTVTASPGDTVATSTGSPVVMSGLTAGTAYTFTVTATNAIGTSVSSAPSNSVVPLSANPELLSDPGFEVGNSGWKAFDTGTLTRTTTPVYSGARALKVVRSQTTATKTGITLNDTMKTTVAGKLYTASCYVRASVSGLNMYARLMEYSQNYATSTSFPSTAVSITSLPANTWQLVSFSAVAVKNNERMIPQFYSTNQYASTGSISYDGCSFKAGS